MIRVDRGEAPSAFSSPELENERQKAEAFFAQPVARRVQQRYTFRGLTRFEGVRDALISLFHSKCAYCESSIGLTTPVTIDRFRPINGAVNRDGAFDQDHYWWLAYEWFNAYPVCQLCNSMKGNRFPVAGLRASLLAPEAVLREEQALLLDPCFDQPEQHLVFSQDGLVASETIQGRTTIDVVGLNRTGLVEARRETYGRVEAELSTFETELSTFESFAVTQRNTDDSTARFLNERFRELYDARQPYAALRRQVFVQWLNKRGTIERMGRQVVTQALNALLGELSASDRATFVWSLSATTVKKLGLTVPGTAVRRTTRAHPPSYVTPIAMESGSQSQGLVSVSIQSSSGKTRQEEQAIVKRFQIEQSSAETYSVEDEGSNELYYSKRRVIERIEIRNFKGIRDLTLSFGTSESASTPCVVLLGENGTGKSSILKAIAIALMGERHRQELQQAGLLDAARFVRYGTRSGFVKIYLLGIIDPIELHFRKGVSEFEGNATDPKTPLLAYGATRLLPRTEVQTTPSGGLARTRNLFDPFVSLYDANAWLSDLPKAKFDNVARGLKALMLLDDEDRLLKSRSGDIKVHTFGERVWLRDLSDGYQTVLALVVDIMSVMQARWELMEIAEGVVLVDELDAHLHPRWKMQIVKRLRQTFPRVQFIVTTHDPLCLRGFFQPEVAVMQRNAEDIIIALTDLSDPNALRVDQLLTSEYFGLNSTVDPDVELLFNEYYELLALRQLTEQQTARLADLKQQLEGRELLGATRRERLMLEAADQFVAQQTNEPDRRRRVAMQDEARDIIVDLWSTLDVAER